jgi:hypothetical protein
MLANAKPPTPAPAIKTLRGFSALIAATYSLVSGGEAATLRERLRGLKTLYDSGEMNIRRQKANRMTKTKNQISEPYL